MKPIVLVEYYNKRRRRRRIPTHSSPRTILLGQRDSEKERCSFEFILIDECFCLHSWTNTIYIYIYIYIISSISPFVPFAFQDLQPCHSRFWPTRKMIYNRASRNLFIFSLWFHSKILWPKYKTRLHIVSFVVIGNYFFFKLETLLIMSRVFI